eukprot:1458209-Ditylum_brightwellii.AAC.1
MLGRWLGISHQVGSFMCYWILTEAGKVIARTSNQHVARDNYLDIDIKKWIDEFNEVVNTMLRDDNFQNKEFLQFYLDNKLEDAAYGDGSNTPDDTEYGDMAKDVSCPEQDDMDDNTYDKYIGAEIEVEGLDGECKRGMVKNRKKGPDGCGLGRVHRNPLFDTWEYKIVYEDGTTDCYHDKSAITKQDGYNLSKNGNYIPKKATRGWSLCVEWKDGITNWIILRNLKHSNPVEVAEYALANGIDDEPTFNWWARHTLRKCDRIIAKSKS